MHQCFLFRKAVYSYCQDTNFNTTYQSKYSTLQIQATSKQELNPVAHDWGMSLPSWEDCPVGNMLLEALTGAKAQPECWQCSGMQITGEAPAEPPEALQMLLWEKGGIPDRPPAIPDG